MYMCTDFVITSSHLYIISFVSLSDNILINGDMHSSNMFLTSFKNKLHLPNRCLSKMTTLEYSHAINPLKNIRQLDILQALMNCLISCSGSCLE